MAFGKSKAQKIAEAMQEISKLELTDNQMSVVERMLEKTPSKWLPNIVTISGMVSILTAMNMTMSFYLLIKMLGMLGNVEVSATEDGEVVVQAVEVVKIMATGVGSFVTGGIALTGVTGLIMIMKDVATAPPGKPESIQLIEALKDWISSTFSK